MLFLETRQSHKKHVPLKKVSKKQHKSKPWITKTIKKSIEQKNKALKRYINAKSESSKQLNFEKYKLLRNKTVELIKVIKKVHFRGYFQKNIKNSKEILKGIRNLVSLKKDNSSNNITLNIGGKIQTDPNIAEEFNNYFINISKHIKEKIPPTRKHFSEYLKRSSINSFFFQPIETEEICI